MAEEFGKGVVPFRRYGDRYLNYEAIAGGNEGSSAAQAQANTSSSDYGANVDGGPGTGQTMGGPGHGTQQSGTTGQPVQPQGFTDENPYSTNYGANVTQGGTTQTGVQGYGFRNKDLSNPSVPELATAPPAPVEDAFTDENPYSVAPQQTYNQEEDSALGSGYRGATSYGTAVDPNSMFAGKVFEGQQLPGAGGALLHQVGKFSERNLDNIQAKASEPFAEQRGSNYQYGEFGNQRLGISPGIGGIGEVYSGPQQIQHLGGINVAGEGNVANAKKAIEIAKTQPSHTTASGNVLYGDVGANKAKADRDTREQETTGGGTYLSAVTDTSGKAVTSSQGNVAAARSYVAPREESSNDSSSGGGK